MVQMTVFVPCLQMAGWAAGHGRDLITPRHQGGLHLEDTPNTCSDTCSHNPAPYISATCECSNPATLTWYKQVRVLSTERFHDKEFNGPYLEHNMEY